MHFNGIFHCRQSFLGSTIYGNLQMEKHVFIHFAGAPWLPYATLQRLVLTTYIFLLKPIFQLVDTVDNLPQITTF